METTPAAAAKLYKFAIRSTIGDNYPPKYTHYLPLAIVDRNGNPNPVIAQLDDTTFVVKNEYGIKPQHSCGGVHAYVSPQHHDLCPEECSYYPKGSEVKAQRFNPNWIQVIGSQEVPGDIKVRQVAQFAHAIPYWQQFAQELQNAQASADPSGTVQQLALEDGPRSQPGEKPVQRLTLM